MTGTGITRLIVGHLEEKGDRYDLANSASIKVLAMDLEDLLQANHKPREQWTFTGRETHWGYTFLVWTRDDGKRWVRWVE